MEINVTDDSLELISSYLSPVSRLNLAALNEQFYYACTVWRDVKTIVFDIDDITLAAPNMVHKYVYSSIDRMTSIRTALKMCPGIKRLIIQAKLKESDISVLNENPSLISKLYISTENLGLQDFPVFKRLRTLHIVANSMKEYRVMNTIGPKILQSAFPMCLRRICLTDVYLTSNLIEYLSTLPNLTYLDLIGCLVDTNVAPKYIESLEKCQSLEELSLPPSFFSFTTSNRKLDADKKISFKKLRLTKLALYMDIFNEESFLDEIRNKMPSKLLALVIFGNYIPLKKWKRLKEIKTFLIIFGPNESIASCPQANLTNIKLLSHLVRRPPYNPSRSFLSPLDMTIENISWRFSLVDWQTQNTAPPTIPPDRLLIQDDVEDPIRFLRRLNRFADHNTLLPAAPPQHIPLANQTAPRQTRQIRSTSAPQRTAQGNVRRRVSHERDRRLQSTPNRTDSMQTHPPTPPVSTIQMSQRTPIIQEITANSTVGTMNRGFVQSANTSNVSEMTMSPERINPVVTVVPNRGSRIEPNNEGTQMIVETLANNIDMIIPSEQNNSQNNQQATRNTVPPPPRD